MTNFPITFITILLQFTTSNCLEIPTYSSSCPSGGAIIGFGTHVGWAIDFIFAICDNGIAKTKVPSGEELTAKDRSIGSCNSGGPGLCRWVCPHGSTVSKLQLWEYGDGKISGHTWTGSASKIELYCNDPKKTIVTVESLKFAGTSGQKKSILQCKQKNARMSSFVASQKLSGNNYRNNCNNGRNGGYLCALAVRCSSPTSTISNKTTAATTGTRGWAPKSKAGLNAAIGQCLKLSTDCSKGPSGPIGSWDVSAVTDMSHSFDGYEIFAAQSFNGDISNWDVSRVTDMRDMFDAASSFNGDISKWDVSRVTDMRAMFHVAESFNRDLSKWDVSRVKVMAHMFSGASSFAQTLCGAWRTTTADKDRMFDQSPGRICTTTSTRAITTSTSATIATTTSSAGSHGAEHRCYERTANVFMGTSGVTVQLSKPLRVMSGSATMWSNYHSTAHVYLTDDAGQTVGEFHMYPKGNTKVDNTITLRNGKQFPITVASYKVYAWWNSAILRTISFTCTGAITTSTSATIATTTSSAADPEEQLRPSSVYGTLAILGTVAGILLCLCVIIIISVLVCRSKAKRTRQDQGGADAGHAIQRMATVMAGAIEIPTENSIYNVPTAAETGLPLANATLIMPPASTEGVDSLPVAVAYAVDAV